VRWLVLLATVLSWRNIRLLRDPKPLVVGIAWVVECVEQRARVDESQFIVNLEDINTAGINKVSVLHLPSYDSTKGLHVRSDDGPCYRN
jgi:hypothetical protein